MILGSTLNSGHFYIAVWLSIILSTQSVFVEVKEISKLSRREEILYMSTFCKLSFQKFKFKLKINNFKLASHSNNKGSLYYNKKAFPYYPIYYLNKDFEFYK